MVVIRLVLEDCTAIVTAEVFKLHCFQPRRVFVGVHNRLCIRSAGGSERVRCARLKTLDDWGCARGVRRAERAARDATHVDRQTDHGRG